MGRWLVLLFLIGAALIGLGLTDYIPEDMNLYALGGGGVLILLVLIFWWLGRRKRKAMQQSPKFVPKGVGMRAMPGTNEELKREYERKKKIEAETKKRRRLTTNQMRELDRVGKLREAS